MFFTATLKSKNIHALNPGVEKFRSQKVLLIKGWRAEKGPYFGQQCYMTDPYLGWIPESELKDMREISYPEWKSKKSCKNYREASFLSHARKEI
jgi:hypothetical protein